MLYVLIDGSSNAGLCIGARKQVPRVPYVRLSTTQRGECEGKAIPLHFCMRMEVSGMERLNIWAEGQVRVPPRLPFILLLSTFDAGKDGRPNQNNIRKEQRQHPHSRNPQLPSNHVLHSPFLLLFLLLSSPSSL